MEMTAVTAFLGLRNFEAFEAIFLNFFEGHTKQNTTQHGNTITMEKGKKENKAQPRENSKQNASF